jgi:hypothetical protein
MAGRHLHHCHRLQAGLRGLGSAFLIAPLAAFSVTHALGGRVPRQPRGSLGRSLADWPGAFGRCWLAAVAGWQGKRAVLLRCCRRLVLLAAESLDPPCDCLRRTAELPCCRDLRHLAGRHGAHDVLTAWLSSPLRRKTHQRAEAGSRRARLYAALAVPPGFSPRRLGRPGGLPGHPAPAARL